MWAEIVVGKFIFQLAQAVRIRTGPVYWSCLNGNICTVVVARQANGPQAPTASAGLPFARSDCWVGLFPSCGGMPKAQTFKAS